MIRYSNFEEKGLFDFQASVGDINIYQFEVEKGWILVLLKGAPGKNNDEKIGQYVGTILSNAFKEHFGIDMAINISYIGYSYFFALL